MEVRDSLKEFWINLKTGAGFRSPRAIVDSPRLDAKQISDMLRGAVIWLTPKSVEGFSAGDFDFLLEPVLIHR